MYIYIHIYVCRRKYTHILYIYIHTHTYAYVCVYPYIRPFLSLSIGPLSLRSSAQAHAALEADPEAARPVPHNMSIHIYAHMYEHIIYIHMYM